MHVQRGAVGRVERTVLAILLIASLVAILTTFGIFASLVFETVRFFGMVSPIDFLVFLGVFALGYALTLGITTLLVTGLLLAAGGFVGDQRERTIRGEMQVVGQQVASDLTGGDRFVQLDGTDFTITREIPQRVVGVSYTIAVAGTPGDPYLELTTDDPEVTVTVGTTPTGIYVADDGPGIPSEEHGLATDIGYSGRADGTGLGLAIVAEVAAAHG